MSAWLDQEIAEVKLGDKLIDRWEKVIAFDLTLTEDQRDQFLNQARLLNEMVLVQLMSLRETLSDQGIVP